MSGQDSEKQQRIFWLAPILILALIIAVAIAWRIWPVPGKQAASPEKPVLPQTPAVIESNQPVSQSPAKGPVTIEDVIKIRQHWDPAFIDWVGKQAPDFGLVDLNGNAEKLGNYRGKIVMLVFWATWCPPCRMEIPGLIELRRKVSPADLAIIAVSYENPENIKSFAAKNDMNYSLFSASPTQLPVPFSMINAIPITFFIDKTGVIRLVTEGLVTPKEDELILEALGLKQKS